MESFVDAALLESPHRMILPNYAMQATFGNRNFRLQVFGSTLFVKRRRDGRVAEGGGLLNLLFVAPIYLHRLRALPRTFPAIIRAPRVAAHKRKTQ